MKTESFAAHINGAGVDLSRTPTEIVQINMGKLCNQACLHCHVEAGPKRTENMDLPAVDRLIGLLQRSTGVSTIDLTGGAPELNPHFRYLVEACRTMGKRVIDRCNLTVLFEPGQEETADFLAYHNVEVVASLPCYSKENVEKQRGRGVFSKSVEALRKLNKLGYGRPGGKQVLNLVYNPGGAFLPPAQEKLEQDYKEELRSLFDIEFNHLFTITNMPIKRFLFDLERQGKLEEYMQLLVDNFNPLAAESVMCRNLVSVSWDGSLYDCDFNQMLEMPLGGKPRTIWDIETFSDFERESIAVGSHCYGCTAGAGSSCGGATV